jgi:hypothetical protein
MPGHREPNIIPVKIIMTLNQQTNKNNKKTKEKQHNNKTIHTSTLHLKSISKNFEDFLISTKRSRRNCHLLLKLF